MDQHKEMYLQEASELIEELEIALLALEENSNDSELIDRVFRALHTIKGSGAMFGFEDIAAFTHEIETVFDLVREGKMKVRQDLIDLALSSKDMISQMLMADGTGGSVDQEEIRRIITSVNKLAETAKPSEALTTTVVEDEETLPAPEHITEEVTYRIRFIPFPEIFKNGTNPILLLEELCEMGRASVVAHTEKVPGLMELNATSCYIFWDIILTTSQDVNAIKDVFIFVEDDCELDIQLIPIIEDDIEDDCYHKRMGEILVERGDVSREDIQEALKRQKRLGEHLVEAQLITPNKVSSAVVEQEHVRKVRKKRKEDFSGTSIRVRSEKLDALVNLVGELVTVQARLTQKTTGTNDPDLLLISEEVERLTAELRDNTMSVRMLPLGTTFASFKRLVRDLTIELGKEVVLTTDGGETELDKNIIEKLKDPLVHIIRNSIDHGIEAPKARESAGKNRQGQVHLSANHSGAHVLITISDDGSGLDALAIKNKAVERGIISSEAQLSESDIYHLIFEPGFSTAKTLTGVSGRGVGMDVVKQSIESLRGGIEVRSQSGKGTTIVLKLPLTLAIIDGLMVKIDEGDYVLPLSVVEECVELRDEDLQTARKRKIMNIRGDIVPYIRLRELFDIKSNGKTIEQVVIVESGGERFGFGVDRVVGQLQTVIKSLGSVYGNVKGTSGATILGDGSVALILDVSDLTQMSAIQNMKGGRITI